MLSPANYYFLHQETRFFVCLQPVKKLHSVLLNKSTHVLLIKIGETDVKLITSQFFCITNSIL